MSPDAGGIRSSDAGAAATDATASDRDERLAELVGRMFDELRQGKTPDVHEHARAAPDLAEELRSLWAAILVADCAASVPADDLELTTPNALEFAARTGGAAIDLPRRFGDFELLSELGRGGMGIVYRARQLSLDRIVALKMILGGRLAPAADLARFRAESRSVAQLNHPQIVPVYEVGEEAGQPYFTMKYVDGTTLARRLAEGPMPAREAAAILAPVARAIHYAHEQGVLHRDLKPSNILLDVDGGPHVSDFGLAKRVEGNDPLTLTGAILGTPCYMAPEQAAGTRGKLGPASDVYSLGTMLYQMLTGRPPFQAASPVDTVLLVLEQDPLPPRLLNPRADRELEMISLKCLQKPPDLRYPSAAALADDLESYLVDEPIAARSGLLSQVVMRWFRETHHATVLENWGLLWMWHSLVLIVLCLATNWMQWREVQSPLAYLAVWVTGLGTWAVIFWGLRRRSGPVTFVERQVAHVWGGSMAASAGLFVVETLLGMAPLTLSPVLALIGGTVFFIKAGILTGRFYVQSAALFATAVAMAVLQAHDIRVGISLFGFVSAACFFFPGLKYYRQRRASMER